MDDANKIMINVPLWGWVVFNLFVFLAIIIDLFILHRHQKIISTRQALLTSALWVGMALIFNLGIFFFQGKETALNFLAGYLIEEALSIDNLFVFALIFNYFHTPQEHQHKVLFWGILGAVMMRALFIFFGISLVTHFHWILYLFGIFLIYAALKIALPKDEKILFENNAIIHLLKKVIPLSSTYDGDHFFTLKNNKWWATPLFTALITVEITDLIFAVDSIPAVMAITLDPFIVYTSNIFAVLGLRSLYFALANLLPFFHFLKYALAAILAFVGLKMLLKPFIEISIGLSLGFILIVLTLAIALSLAFPSAKKK